jgi:hypothetical protein
MQAMACWRCGGSITLSALQVESTAGRAHRECFEAWFFGRHGVRPRLTPGKGDERHVYRLPPRRRARVPDSGAV